MPELYLSIMLAIVGVLLITALLTRETDPPAGDPRDAALRAGPDAGGSPAAAWCDLDRNALRNSARQAPRGNRPFRDLEAALSASYAARLEQAVRRIRIGPSAGARPTDQAAG
jgi:hypothetical protein